MVSIVWLDCIMAFVVASLAEEFDLSKLHKKINAQKLNVFTFIIFLVSLLSCKSPPTVHISYYLNNGQLRTSMNASARRQ
jgi:hypothetical protein